MEKMWVWKDSHGHECVANEAYTMIEELWRDGMILFRQNGSINYESPFFEWFKNRCNIEDLFDILFRESYATNEARKVLNHYFDDFRDYLEGEKIIEEGKDAIIEGYYPNGMDLIIPWEEVEE